VASAVAAGDLILERRLAAERKRTSREIQWASNRAAEHASEVQKTAALTLRKLLKKQEESWELKNAAQLAAQDAKIETKLAAKK
jgi:hypothetical protein